jgi:hypothetical protein
MKVIRKKADAEGAAPAAAAAAPAAKPAGIKVVSRAPPPPAVSQEQIDSKKVAKLLERLTLGEHDAHCDGNNDIGAVVGAAGFASLQASGLLTKLKAEAEDTSHADGREAALLGFKQLCSSVGRPCEPYVVPLLPMMLERLADKVAPVREAAAQAAHAVVTILCPHAVELVLPGESRATAGRTEGSSGRGYVGGELLYVDTFTDNKSGMAYQIKSRRPEVMGQADNNCTVQIVGVCVGSGRYSHGVGEEPAVKQLRASGLVCASSRIDTACSWTALYTAW